MYKATTYFRQYLFSGVGYGTIGDKLNCALEIRHVPMWKGKKLYLEAMNLS